jgi:hypothetical protein
MGPTQAELDGGKGRAPEIIVLRSAEVLHPSKMSETSSNNSIHTSRMHF